MNIPSATSLSCGISAGVSSWIMYLRVRGFRLRVLTLLIARLWLIPFEVWIAGCSGIVDSFS